ncbi:two-component sensor histidine kinase [Bradyrhizobium sp. GM0.4]
MLDWSRHSDEAGIGAIVARHAAIGKGGQDSASREQQFRELLQALPAAIYTTDAEGRVTFFNRACIEFAGRTPSIGDMWCVTWKLYLSDGTAAARGMPDGRRAEGEPAGARCRGRRRATRRVAHLLHAVPDPRCATRGGRMVGVINTLVDITTRKQAEERMMLLTAEVDHRSNNLLAVTQQAMLRLTKADTVEEFQAAFQGRLGALGRSNGCSRPRAGPAPA